MKTLPPDRALWLKVLPFVWLGVLGCAPQAGSGRAGPPEFPQWPDQVTVVSYPLYEALSTACGEQLELFHPEVPAGQVMDRDTARRVQASRLIIVDGTHHAGWVDTVTLPESRKRLSTFEIMDRLIMVDNLGSHSHGPGGEHSHQGIVAQTWLDPALLQQQLRTVLQACAAAGLLPASSVDEALQAWGARVEPLEQKIQELAQLPSRRVMADQSGAEYLFRRLGWPVEIQEFEPLFRADSGQLERELAQRKAEDPSLVIVISGRPRPELTNMLEKLAIPIIMLDLIETAGPAPYVDRLNENLKNIEKVALIPF